LKAFEGEAYEGEEDGRVPGEGLAVGGAADLQGWNLCVWGRAGAVFRVQG
jgi:hypothetical protein